MDFYVSGDFGLFQKISKKLNKGSDISIIGQSCVPEANFNLDLDSEAAKGYGYDQWQQVSE